jgi:peptide deformylase
MAVRRIRIWPDPALKEKAKPVGNVDGAIKALVDDLFETMYKANGVGLAATQVAEGKRVLVIDLDPKAQGKSDDDVRAELDAWGFKGPTAFINPEIITSEGSIVWQEGCLSVPGYTDEVKRKESVIVRAVGVDGEVFDTEATGLFAVALQHEMDHLEGRVFVEYLSKLKRDVVRRKMDRVREEAEDDGVVAALAL